MTSSDAHTPFDPGEDLSPGVARAAPVRGSSYSRVAIALHWIIALVILLQIALGWNLHHIPAGPQRFSAFQLHKSIGLSILVLSVARLAWRISHPAPPEERLPAWQHLASRLVHWGLYLIMIGLPLTGWIMVSTSKLPIPTRYFGLVPWPAFPGMSTLSPAAKAGWNALGSGGHSALVYVTVAMLVLHLGAVGKHQIVDRDHVFARMVPPARPGWREPYFWVASFAAVVAVAAGFTLAGGRGKLPRHHDDRIVPAAMPPTTSSRVTLPVTASAPALPPPSTKVTSAGGAPPAKDALAGPTKWAVEKGNLQFSTHWGDTSIAGTFSRWTADILFSPQALDKSNLTIHVDVASASTGDSQRDAALPTSDWFDSAAYPSAIFRSSQIRSTGGTRYLALGVLELRGVRHGVEVPFTVTISHDRAQARGTVVVDRTVFGVGQGDWAATDQIPATVAVTFDVTAHAKAQANGD